jgi:hypothetical protein
VVKVDEEYGTIDIEGHPIIDPTYAWIGPLHKGSHPFARSDNAIGFLSASGRMLMEPLLPSRTAAVLHGRHAICQHDNRRFGVYNAEGLVYECMLALAPSGEGPLVIQLPSDNEGSGSKGRWHLLHDDGTLTGLPADTIAANAFCDERATIIFPDRIAVIDSAGKQVNVVAGADYAREFTHDGLALFRRNGLFGYINRSGLVVIEARFTSADIFSEGLASAALPKKPLGYIDTTGRFVIAPRYDSGRAFHHGRAFVWHQADRTSGFIDTSGDFVVTLSPNGQTMLTDFGEDGFAYVERDGFGVYLNRQGETVGEPQNAEIVRPLYLPNMHFAHH